MSIRTFFLLSLSFAILAIGLHLTAMSQISRGDQIRVRAVRSPESGLVAAKAEASGYYNRGAVVRCSGIAFALASVAFVIVSMRKHEPARRIFVLGVLICYVMLQFVLVC